MPPKGVVTRSQARRTKSTSQMPQSKSRGQAQATESQTNDSLEMATATEVTEL